MERNGWRITKLKLRALRLVFGAVLLAALPAPAQYGMGKPPQQPQQPAQTGQPAAKPGETPAPATPPVNQEEEDAAKAFFDMKTDTTQSIPAGENFLLRFPDSRYRDSVYEKLVHDYLNAGQEDKVIATGNKALQTNPDNVGVLAFMSWYLGHRHHPNALDAEQQLQLVEKYGRHGLDLIAKMEKPANVTEESFERVKNESLGLCHSGLGLYNFWQNRTPEMVAELSQSTLIDPTPDPIDFYLLGDGDARLKKFADAAAAYERCSLSAWAWQDKCKTKMAQAKALAAAQPASPAPPAAPAAPAAPAPAADAVKPKPPGF